jgi:flavin-dependent dehydrogenase
MIATTVLIIGAGPAGAACATRLQQASIDFILLDQHPFPRMKPCAGWVTPQALSAIGFSPAQYLHSFTTFNKFVISIHGVRFTLPTRQYAIRRAEFDHWLLERADLHVQQHQVKHIRQTADGYEIDGTYTCQYLVGAGGTYCPVYRTLFRETVPRPQENMIVAFEQEFEYGYTDPRCHLWFMENGLPGYAWYVPKANGFLNVGIGAKAEKLKKTGGTIQARWDELTTKLEAMGLVRGHPWSPVSHTYYLRPQPLSATRIDNAFLVGDAACLSTRDMGEGIGPALLSGQRAAQAIITGEEYVLDDIPSYSLPSIIFSRFGNNPV